MNLPTTAVAAALTTLLACAPAWAQSESKTCAMVLMHDAGSSPVAVAGFGLAGLGFGWAMTGLSTVVQERAPEELRGRIMALWLVGFVGSRPIAAVLLGGLADTAGVQAAFAVAAALTAAVAVLCRTARLTGPVPG